MTRSRVVGLALRGVAIAVVAIVIATLASCNDDEATTTEIPTATIQPSYTEFLKQVRGAPDHIDGVTIDASDGAVIVTEATGQQYTTGFPSGTLDALEAILKRNGIAFSVEGG